MAVEVGAEFNTFDDLTNAIQVYEAENFVNLIIRDTRKVESAAKRNQRKQYNPAIKYSDIAYCCTYGGKKYVCHSTGKRNHKTIKQACPFSMKVRATVDGQRLFIREMCVTHNHQISEVDFRLHPKQRKLDIDSQEEIANLLSFEPDKKLLRDKLMQITGKVILMKDIHNIKTRLLNPRMKQKDIKRETVYNREDHTVSEGMRVSEDVNVSAGSNVSDAKIETAEVETQTKEGEAEEICLPHSHVVAPQIDASHHSIMFHQQNQQMDSSHIQDCFINNHIYNSQEADTYSRSIQSFQPTDDYSINSRPFQQTSSDIISDSISHVVINPSVKDSQHLQHWTALLDVDHQTVEELVYQTVSAYPYSDQQNNSYSTIQQQQVQNHTPHITNLQPVPLAVLENISSVPQVNQRQDQQNQSLLEIKQTKRQLRIKNREKKRRINSDQKDKETIIKKYFQQATVNLFFNERLKYPANKFLKALRPGVCTTNMSEGSADNRFDESLKQLSWLFGTWRSTEGKGIYPNISDFTYSEEAVFQPVGMKPIVDYRMYSWKTDNNMPMHREKGFIRIKPKTNQIAFVAAHTMGVVEVQEGEVNGHELIVESKNIGRTSFNLPPEVKLVRRSLKLKGSSLEQVVYMQTDRTELTEHLRVTYKKVE